MESQQNDKIFSIKNDNEFREVALWTFRRQYGQNSLYREFCDILGVTPKKVNSLEKVPFLPIRFFKSHEVKTGSFEPELVFESSGTTGMRNSRHLVKSAELYKESFMEGFRLAYGEPSKYCILGLLPSYLERGNSSLVHMVGELIRRSENPDSGFYLREEENLHELLLRLEDAGQPAILIGVTFALLDFAEKYRMNLRHTIVMETGGMKGRRKEMIREELHSILKDAFGVSEIHAEYGMTELLSQAYSKGNGIFHCPPWMKVFARDETDPLRVGSREQGAGSREQGTVNSGALNIIDLANIHSCSFIATDDACRIHADGSFEVTGRLDGSDLRGCSLLINQLTN